MGWLSFLVAFVWTALGGDWETGLFLKRAADIQLYLCPLVLVLWLPFVIVQIARIRQKAFPHSETISTFSWGNVMIFLPLWHLAIWRATVALGQYWQQGGIVTWLLVVSLLLFGLG